VGDNRHTTFFEMLGNWSLGDYFKKEQIPWMWEFLTEELSINPERLYFTCFKGHDPFSIPRDTESAELWQAKFKERGIEAHIADNVETDGMKPGERIFYYPEKKNWWSRAGVTANMPVGEPGGPDTEMFFDFDPNLSLGLHEKSAWAGKACHPNCDCGRFVEIGNNVFMEYVKTDSGFEKLEQKNVDFGGGFERMLAAVNNNPDIFLTDIFEKPRKEIEKLSGKAYGEALKETYAMRVILDHLRGATFLIADGVNPSNKDQGYFTRRLIRRAIRFARDLGVGQNFTESIIASYVETYRDQYQHVGKAKEKIIAEVKAEEEKFRKTLDSGLKEFEKGTDPFILATTYGFPIELTEELAAEKGILIDRAAFDAQMKEHQDRSRAGAEQKFKGGLANTNERTVKLHTAHHLLLAALQEVLGKEVKQRGSNITEERLRIDFNFDRKVTPEELAKVETLVNSWIAAQLPVVRREMPREEAEKLGAEMEFGAKYPDIVSVYTIQNSNDDYVSKEFCGGPHVANTSEIGAFKIQKEEASSAGIRRIKATVE
jgi:alanyl-tRNA synthetase